MKKNIKDIFITLYAFIVIIAFFLMLISFVVWEFGNLFVLRLSIAIAILTIVYFDILETYDKK